MNNEEINVLTDPQINVMMTMSVNNATDYKPNEKMNTIYKISNQHVGGISVINVGNYCGDSSTMMKIVFENGISLINTDGSGEYTACGVGVLVDGYCGDSRHDVYVGDCEIDPVWCDKNPLRAAAIVYLKMKGIL
ncbi:MAG: hypothetical protein ACRDDY_15475 [Clostridium sp.]|uniref:hypothetical protein n=1 Tax=Clostridium sp. TaxID=1506 RepID=UPI003EE65321